MTESKKIWLLYSGAILLGAFLMFLIQPLIGKIITPMYGGTSQVWTVCLLFFQLALLGGYTLTWCLSKLKPKLQAVTYIVLMAASAFMIHIPLRDSWAPPDNTDPVYSLLTNLMIYLAIPAILLSTVSTTIQNWFRIAARQSPFQLYSISNIGSLGALLTYPILIEPNWTIGKSLDAWIWGYRGLVVFACLSAAMLLLTLKKSTTQETEDALKSEPVPGDQDRRLPLPEDFMKWTGLSALGTSLLISFTTYMTQNIAPIPLLWIVPLVFYLLTFILCFGNENFYKRTLFIPLSQGMLFSIYFIPQDQLQILVCLLPLLLFCLCMICHGEIYASRPKAEALPAFYLSIAFGGALGGILLNLVAPVVFNAIVEYHWLLVIMSFLTLGLFYKQNLRLFYHQLADKIYMLLALGLIGWFTIQVIAPKEPYITTLKKRNFYGSVALRIVNSELAMVHGTTIHGSQRFDPVKKRFFSTPTMYFTRQSGANVAHKLMQKRRGKTPLKMGVIGLGVGTLASYTVPGDQITFYELDPKVTEIAQDNFRFLADSKGKVNIIMGDGRLSLQKQSPQQYDLLFIDAFNSDSVPVHLLTKEALQLYKKHLKSDGLIVFQMSNSYVDLTKATGNLSINQKMPGIHLYGIAQDGVGDPSCYSILSTDDWFIKEFTALNLKKDYPQLLYHDPEWHPAVGVWTDDYSNLFSVLFSSLTTAKWHQ